MSATLMFVAGYLVIAAAVFAGVLSYGIRLGTGRLQKIDPNRRRASAESWLAKALDIALFWPVWALLLPIGIILRGIGYAGATLEDFLTRRAASKDD